ncbi:MAG: hypothetical protein WBC44_12305 [Planctomycetaceae bacterium]
MPSRRTSILLLVAVFAPFFFGAVSVAAGHALPAYLSRYVDGFDSAIILANAVIGPGVAAVCAFQLVSRRRFRVVAAVLWFFASLPAYTHSYFFFWQWFSDLGIGMVY